MDRLDLLHVFVRVAEMSGFTPAANSLGLPKSSVSNAIKDLEQRLGATLLRRTTRRVALTPDGQTFYDRAKVLLADADDLQSMFQQDEADISGRLRVDMPVGMARNLIIPALPGFLAAHPRIEIELGCTDRRVDLIKEGYDCVIRVGPLTDSRLIARPLGRVRLINCAAPSYLVAFGQPQSLDDLSRHRLVHYAQSLGSPPDGFEVEDAEGVRTIPMAGVVTVNSSISYEAACLAGLGIVQGPEMSLRHLIAEGALLEVLPGYRASPMPINLLHAGGRHLPKRTQRFMDWISRFIRPYAA